MPKRPSNWINLPNAKDLFMLTVQRGEGCWEWTGYRDRNGYGRVAINGKQAPASRVAYQLFIGPIPNGHVVRHYECDNPPCVRPEHLRVGTVAENIGDSSAKGRQTGGKYRILPEPRQSTHHIENRRPLGWFDLPNARDLFMQSVTKTDSCWLWNGARKKSGHGVLMARGRKQPAHRISYLLFNGPVANGKHVLHGCDNPPCVNPAHLHLGTHAENMGEAATRKRFQYGDDHWTHRNPERLATGERHHSQTHPESVPSGERHWTKRNPELARENARRTIASPQFTDEQVLAMRQLAKDGMRVSAIARRMQARPETVRRIVYGFRRPDLPGALPYERSNVHWAKRNPDLARQNAHGGFAKFKFTDDQVRVVRKLAAQGTPMTVIASRMGMNKDTVKKFILGKLRADLPGALICVGRGKFAVPQ